MEKENWMYSKGDILFVEATVGETVEEVDWEMIQGTLPPGVRFQGKGGIFDGEIRESGTYEITLRGTASNGISRHHKIKFICDHNPTNDDFPEESPTFLEKE